MTKDTLIAAAKNFRSMSPGVRAAIERLTPEIMSQDDVDDLEGDWLVAEVLLNNQLPADRDGPLVKAHEMIRKLLIDRAARMKP